MNILEALDKTKSAHSAAKLADCDPKTVRRSVACREAGSAMDARRSSDPGWWTVTPTWWCSSYQRRSIAATSNIHPSGFDDLMPKTLALTAVDRLLHTGPARESPRPRARPRDGHRIA